MKSGVGHCFGSVAVSLEDAIFDQDGTKISKDNAPSLGGV